MTYFIIYKLDILFSALIPNFFFKVSNTEDQFSKISLEKKKVSNKLITKSFVNKSFLNNNVLLLALYLQKASILLTRLDTSSYTKVDISTNFLLNLNLIPNYGKNLSSTIFLFTKTSYNNSYNYEFNVTKLDSLYNIQYKDLNYLNTYNSTIDFITLFNSDFKLQKLISNNISKNLNLSKQNRWM
jgi:hypothetical protein